MRSSLRSIAVQRSMRFRPIPGTHRPGAIGTAIVGAGSGVQQHDGPVVRTADPVRQFIGQRAPESHGGEQWRDTPDERRDDRRVPEPPPAAKQGGRLAGIVAVTVIEAASIFAWLWLHINDHPWWGLLALLVGGMVETAVLQKFVDRGGVRRWGELSPKALATGHLRKMQRIVGIAGNVETAIWVLWLACALAVGQEIAAGALLVAMHLKHQIETASVRDLPYRRGILSPKALFGSAMEVAGAVACLAWILDGQFALAAAAIGVGLLIEHWLLIDVLTWEITTRDIRVARDTRWRTPARRRPSVSYLSSHYPGFWRLVQRIAPLVRFGNRRAINSLIGRVQPRPNPLSTMASYTSWASLTDKSFSSRHL